MKFRAIIIYKHKKDDLDILSSINDMNARDHYQFMEVIEEDSIAILKIKLGVKLDLLYAIPMIYDIEHVMRFK